LGTEPWLSTAWVTLLPTVVSWRIKQGCSHNNQMNSEKHRQLWAKQCSANTEYLAWKLQQGPLPQKWNHTWRCQPTRTPLSAMKICQLLYCAVGGTNTWRFKTQENINNTNIRVIYKYDAGCPLISNIIQCHDLFKVELLIWSKEQRNSIQAGYSNLKTNNRHHMLWQGQSHCQLHAVATLPHKKTKRPTLFVQESRWARQRD
jgi:hypothetical protein